MSDENSQSTDAQDKNQRIAELEERVEQVESMLGADPEDDRDGISRRGVLAALTGTGVLGATAGGLFAQTAQAATANGYTQTGELRDGNNNVLAELNNGGPVDFQVPIQTKEAAVTDETYIVATRVSSQFGVASNTWVNVADTEETDNRNEQDSSFNINPDETGKYEVQTNASITPGSDQDTMAARVRDVDNSATLTERRLISSGTNTQPVQFAETIELTAGTNYKIQAINFNSSYDMSKFRTRYLVRREVVGP